MEDIFADKGVEQDMNRDVQFLESDRLQTVLNGIYNITISYMINTIDSPNTRLQGWLKGSMGVQRRRPVASPIDGMGLKVKTRPYRLVTLCTSSGGDRMISSC